MAFYENTLVVKQDLAEKQVKDIKESYNELINKSSGKVIKIDILKKSLYLNDVKSSLRVLSEVVPEWSNNHNQLSQLALKIISLTLSSGLFLSSIPVKAESIKSSYGDLNTKSLNNTLIATEKAVRNGLFVKRANVKKNG